LLNLKKSNSRWNRTKRKKLKYATHEIIEFLLVDFQRQTARRGVQLKWSSNGKKFFSFVPWVELNQKITWDSYFLTCVFAFDYFRKAIWSFQHLSFISSSSRYFSWKRISIFCWSCSAWQYRFLAWLENFVSSFFLSAMLSCKLSSHIFSPNSSLIFLKICQLFRPSWMDK